MPDVLCSLGAGVDLAGATDPAGAAGIDLTPITLVLLALAAFAAGWVDAVVGGGGLIQLPALLLVPGMTPLQAIATNKVGSIMGTSVSALTYYRRVHPDLRTALPMAAAALVAAMLGAYAAALIPGGALRIIILVALVLVGTYTVAKPNLGRATNLRWEGNRHIGSAMGLGVGIGLYDGMLGPGTGTFLIIGLVGVIGYAFLPASAIAKIVNLATNVGALIFFIPNGSVVWAAGATIAAANMVGGYTGARMAIAKGSTFIRVVFLVVVTALILRLGWDAFQHG